MAKNKKYDVAVIGAGVFGAWIAHWLARSGRSVILLDAYGPANSRASSGGESRIIRMGYGGDDLYTRWSMRSLPLWVELFARMDTPLFHRTGVLWIAPQTDRYFQESRAGMERCGASFEDLSHRDLAARYPQIAIDSEAIGMLEPDSGVLLARRAVQAVVDEAIRSGVDYRRAAVQAPTGGGTLDSIVTDSPDAISAGRFVFACGPWLPAIFPDLLGRRIFPSRQEIFFFGVPAGDTRFASPAMPTWLMLSDEFYGMPDIESRGFKLAFDRHGPPANPDTLVRVVSAEGLAVARSYLARRFPALRDAPVVESRVCQYENTSNGDFLIDRHPEFSNVWLIGGGSGHGFKHGPALAEYAAAQIQGSGSAEPRFSLQTKNTLQHRQVF
jgi:glycine/D-amino acid oxidase-like deaminating enzyme